MTAKGQTVHRSATLLTGVSREVHKTPYTRGGRRVDIHAKRFAYAAIAEGKTNKQILDELADAGYRLSRATLVNYREAGEPDDLWPAEVARVNRLGAIVPLKDYGVLPGTLWRIEKDEQTGVVTLTPASDNEEDSSND